ncbi:hypothetical protein Glove_67g46 [Diversispora epigaea]|uniref:Uncharacterized protein n=1 Tax=Diversispora epigaea TaxID=1348612 RepID=A0A397JLC0_9GLOM|nr:hypothetical protein Glove_67g46 [Diversispora epigaea]
MFWNLVSEFSYRNEFRRFFNPNTCGLLDFQKVIKFTFSTNMEQKNLYSVDPQLISNTTINFEPAEASKFSYIIGWILSSEKVVYERDVRSQITNEVPDQDFLDFMYKLESIILLLFEKHNDLENNKLTDEVKGFSIYMKSRQKSWRRFNEFIPEKGTSSLRENLKAMKKLKIIHQ